MAVPYTPGAFRYVTGIAKSCKQWSFWHKCEHPQQLAQFQRTVPDDGIHFNFGLHDLQVVNCSDSSECSEHVPVDVYGSNPVEIYKCLAVKARHVIFATTTPAPAVPTGTSMGRTHERAVQHNAQASMSQSGVMEPELRFDDLWTAVINKCGNAYTTVHANSNSPTSCTLSRQVNSTSSWDPLSLPPSCPSSGSCSLMRMHICIHSLLTLVATRYSSNSLSVRWGSRRMEFGVGEQ